MSNKINHILPKSSLDIHDIFRFFLVYTFAESSPVILLGMSKTIVDFIYLNVYQVSCACVKAPLILLHYKSHIYDYDRSIIGYLQ
jgi:hypothetical protein